MSNTVLNPNELLTGILVSQYNDPYLNESASKTTVNLEKLPTDLLSKQTKNGSSSDEKIEQIKSENGKSSALNNGSSTKKDNGNGVSNDSSNDNSKTNETAKQANDKGKQNDNVKDDKNVSPKVGDKSVEKSKISNEKVIVTNDKQKTSNDSGSGVSKNEEKADTKNGEKEVRESVRQKQIREDKEKEEIVKASKVTPSTPEKNSESLKLKEKQKPETATPSKTTPKTQPSDSILAEKSLKGFNENLEEQESVKLNDSPMPANDAKVLKLIAGPPNRSTRNNRSDKLEDASLVVNLSTVSEQSTESTSTSTPVERNYSLRHITGRRSTRPLRELSFDFRMRESYHKNQNEFSDSVSNTYNSDSPRDIFRMILTAQKDRDLILLYLILCQVPLRNWEQNLPDQWSFLKLLSTVV